LLDHDLTAESLAEPCQDEQQLKIVVRDEWLAQPPSAQLANLNLPVNKVVIAHTATEDCSTQVTL
jgi:peptidoglycan recognition protein LC